MITQNLFAACRTDDGLIVKRVRINRDVQIDLQKAFSDQEQDFFRGVTEEVEFDGAWKPDDKELLTLDVPQEASVFKNALSSTALSVPDMDAAHFPDENVRALFTGDANKVLIQRFAPPQILSRRFSLLLDGNTFGRLSNAAFALDTKLTCVITGGKIKFKSFHCLRQIIDLFDIYKEATNQDLEDFSKNPALSVEDFAKFQTAADQTIRKLVYAISRSDVLTKHSASEIARAAQDVGLSVTLVNGKISVPEDRASIKQLLRFLDDGLYEAPLSGQRYVTNSKRKVKAA